MSVIFVLIPLSILVAAGFLAAFIWAVRSGQYEDTCTPSMRLLVEDFNGRNDRSRPGPSSPKNRIALVAESGPHPVPGDVVPAVGSAPGPARDAASAVDQQPGCTAETIRIPRPNPHSK